KSLMVGQMNMQGFMKALLLKRLESSFFAFSNTVKRFKESYENFLEMYEDGVIYISKKYNVYDLLADENDDKLIRLIEEEEIEKFLIEEFKPSFKKDLIADLDILNNIYSEIEKIKVDPKLEAFIDELKNNPTMKFSKKIIFTESQETADYLKEQLKKALGVPLIAFTGKSNISLKDKIRANFDPNYKKEQDNIYNLLITTDVLAEGINLHRANVLINYDLPWNPTRIMQRVGRINRVGTLHDKLHVFNFFPTSKSNEHLSLKDNITSKITSFQKTLGEDFKYLTEDEETGGYDLYTKLNDRLDKEDEWEESDLEYLQIIRDIRDNDEDLFVKIKNLPKKSRSSKEYEKLNSTNVLSFIKDGELKKIFITDEDYNTKELSFKDAIKILKCDKNEKKVKIEENYYDLLHCNKVYFRETKGGVQVAKKNSKDKKFSDAVKAFESYRKFSGDEENKVKKLKDLAEAGIIPKETIKNIMKKFFEYYKVENNFENQHKLLDFLYDEIPDMYKETKKKKIDITTGKLEVILSEYLI
ncbi:C-terminal helicase domain-containing protein, partial [Fusobacterium ulcerans]